MDKSNPVKEATGELAEKIRQKVNLLTEKFTKDAAPAKKSMGLSDEMVEGIYGQAYRLYNTGKYEDAAQLFRLLVMVNPSEPRYTLGLAACAHLLKDYKNAIELYTVCSIIDGESPIPLYHVSDCYLQVQDKFSAMIALEMAVKRSGNKPEFQTLKDRAEMTVQSLRKELETQGVLKQDASKPAGVVR